MSTLYKELYYRHIYARVQVSTLFKELYYRHIYARGSGEYIVQGAVL